MVLARIQAAVERYRNWLSDLPAHPFDNEWEVIQCFQQYWDPQALDGAAMFNRCLQNSRTRRLWQEGTWQPKRAMLLFWQNDPQTTRLLFQDLFDERRDLEARLGRFLFGCDALLSDYKEAYPTSVENNHYHDDYRMVALYLACRYPEQYGFYSQKAFVGALRAFEARDLPQHHDLVRYFKVLRTLMTFLDKEPAIAAHFHRLLPPHRCYVARSLNVAADFCRFAANGAPTDYT